MLSLLKLQWRLYLGAIALSISLAITLPTYAAILDRSDEGYKPQTFVLSGEQPTVPIPLDWIFPTSQDDRPDSLQRDLSPVPLHQQEVLIDQ
jgi:hypothetical protein